MPSPTAHQQQQDFPRLGTRFVDEDGVLSLPWYRLLINLWRRTGTTFALPAQAIVLQQTDAGDVNVLVAATGVVLGQLQLMDAVGKPAEPVNVNSNPFTYTADSTGTLVVSSGKTELSRDSGATFYVLSLVGLPIPMLKNDQVRVSWFGATAPLVTFFPQS